MKRAHSLGIAAVLVLGAIALNDPTNPVDAAKTALARRLGISPREITVVSVDEAMFTDLSLGCGEPGVAYADVNTPATIVVLQVGAMQYEYRLGSGVSRYCGERLGAF